MRLIHTVILGASIALPVAISGTIVPAHAQQNGLLGQAQRFLNGNQDHNQNQNAYEQGREDQMRQDQARREQWRQEHPSGENQYNQGYGAQRYGQYNPPPPAYNNGYNNNYGYNNDYGNSQGYSR
jgi:Ni/Co efflux regulator RcnB